MKTSKKQTLQNTEERLTLFPEDSLANHTVTLGSEEARKMTVTSGQRCSELFGRYNHVSSWAKTLLDCLVGTTEWYSTKLLLTWKMKDMRHKRFLFQLVPRMPHTEEIEFGLLPTVKAMDGTNEGRKLTDGKSISFKTGIRYGISLPQMANNQMLPTPMAVESIERRNMKTVIKIVETGSNQITLTTMAKYGGLLPTPMASEGTKMSGGLTENQMSLTKMARQGMFCTPTTQSSRGNTSDKRGKGNLTDQIAELELTTLKTSQLNPLFVAEMMGFPPNWTVLPFQSGETNQSKGMEMP